MLIMHIFFSYRRMKLVVAMVTEIVKMLQKRMDPIIQTYLKKLVKLPW